MRSSRISVRQWRRTFNVYRNFFMRIAANIAGGLLGFIFVAISLMVLLHLAPMPPPPAGSPAASFMVAFVPTGWLTVVKICELIGGILVAIPNTRNFGLLFLGPIIVNILCFHILVMNGQGLFGPPIVVAVLAAFLLWAGRRSFAALGN
jgi:putative oxidoreductase